MLTKIWTGSLLFLAWLAFCAWLRRATYGDSSELPLLVTSSTPGHVSLIFRYWNVIDGKFVQDYWINQDVIRGDRIGQINNSAPNSGDLFVNGTFDLVNFFPVALDLSKFTDAWQNRVTYTLYPAWGNTNSFNFCFADVPWSRAGSIPYTKSLIFLHGANVSSGAAEEWGDILFMRFWVSGSRARFYNVDWRSDIDSDANYHRNASNAFVVASQIVSTITKSDQGGDEVLELAIDNDVGILTGVMSPLAHHSWHKQELFKGRGLGVGAGATDWSGWNIEENFLMVGQVSQAIPIGGFTRTSKMCPISSTSNFTKK